MRKLITLLAVTSLMATPFAFADEQTTNTNPNDVLQQVPAHQAAGAEMADASNTNAQAAAPAMDNNAAPAAEQPAKKKHHKHHAKKHHKKHKPKHKKAEAMPAQDATHAPEAAPGGTDPSVAPAQ